MPNSNGNVLRTVYQVAREVFRLQLHSQTTQVGDTVVLALPNAPHAFRLIGLRPWRTGSRHEEVFRVLEGDCSVCGRPYSFEAQPNVQYLPRTCVDHHHQLPKPQPAKREPRRHAGLDLI